MVPQRRLIIGFATDGAVVQVVQMSIWGAADRRTVRPATRNHGYGYIEVAIVMSVVLYAPREHRQAAEPAVRIGLAVAPSLPYHQFPAALGSNHRHLRTFVAVHVLPWLFFFTVGELAALWLEPTGRCQCRSGAGPIAAHHRGARPHHGLNLDTVPSCQ